MELLLTLGHNSSAILVDDNGIVCGYEEERLSKVKSDSSYPKLAIEECLKYCNGLDVETIHVSHWFDKFKLEESKYYQPKHLAARFKNAKIKSLSNAFTHHDAHANSVWNFAESGKSGLTVVADGFGNDGETLSLYRDGVLFHRCYGTSLGLMYQYATSFLGMKENQDEYKLLGLEAHVTKEDVESLEAIISHYANEYIDSMSFSGMRQSVAEVTHDNRVYVHAMLEDALSYCSGADSAVAYFVQSVLERTVLSIISDAHTPGEFMNFSGGIFYNVKLNNAILNSYCDTVEQFEFMPVCGDQGAALGMVDVKIPHLFLGARDNTTEVKAELDNGLTMVLKGAMEFGPRALGNTSCIALPSTENVKLINKINGRPNVMPMAPMIHPSIATGLCRNIEKLGRCKEFMIVATDWMGEVTDDVRGVLHNKPDSGVYTCRPQVVDNEFTRAHGIVINTSLNAHGQPILFDDSDYEEMVRIHEELK